MQNGNIARLILTVLLVGSGLGGATAHADSYGLYAAMGNQELVQVDSGDIGDFAPRAMTYDFANDVIYGIVLQDTTKLAVIDISGRKIRDLHAGLMACGLRTLRWNGRDEQGRVVASGVYFARLSTQGRMTTQTMTLLR